MQSPIRLSAVLRVLLGATLVLHGLGLAVLLLRGVDHAAPGVWRLPLTALALLAIVGFVTAGLGVLGVRPLRRIALVAAFAGSAGALAGLWWLGQDDLLWGVALCMALTALTSVHGRVQAPAAGRGSLVRVAGDAAGLLFLAWIVACALVWPVSRTWGATPADWQMALPGDPAEREPAAEILHAVTIEAPPERVWPWLVQLGQDRGGFYSYESLERLFGVHVRNVREIRPEWQSRKVGDTVFATQPQYLGGLFGERPGWLVTQVDPPRALVLRYWGAFVLQPAGEGRTRFLIRSTISNRRIPVWAAALNFSAFELPHFIMQRRMMLEIKALAEQRGG